MNDRSARLETLKSLCVCAALAAATVLAYWPVVHYPFVNYDDDVLVTQNGRVNTGLTWENVLWDFEFHYPGQWHPLAWFSHQLDCHWFGDNAGRHHLTNLVLHVGAVLLLFAALKRMTGAMWPSAVVAGLFALHPINVESVAWVAERRDVLSGFFFALTLWAYAGYAQRGGIERYVLVTAVFTLGLMAKPMLVTLPCVLMLLDYWPLRRIRGFSALPDSRPGDVPACTPQPLRLLILEKLPLLCLAVASATLSYLCEKEIWSPGRYPLSFQIANAAHSYGAYLRDLVWPKYLSPIYPLPESYATPLWLLPGLVLLAITAVAAVLLAKRRGGYFIVGWLWFLGMLVPVIGLNRMGIRVARADHWGYLPLIGIYVAVAWGLRDLFGRWLLGRVGLAVATVAALVGCAVVTRHQIKYWKDDFALFDRAIAMDWRSETAHNNRGVALEKLHRSDEAYREFDAAVNIWPEYPQANNNLGKSLERLRRYAEARQHCLIALKGKPDYAEAYNNLGNALLGLNLVDEAIASYSVALQLRPNFASPHINLGTVLKKQGKFSQAIEEIRLGLQLDPTIAEAHYNLGAALVDSGQYGPAIDEYTIALKLNPTIAELHNGRGAALVHIGRLQEAINDFRNALAIDPRSESAMQNLRNTQLLLQGQQHTPQ